MKLFAWQPKGHGELSFFVMAETEAEAVRAVEAKIAFLPLLDKGGWGTDYYTLTVVGAGEVLTNDND